MNFFKNTLTRSLGVTAIAAAALLAFQPDVQAARDHHTSKSSKHGSVHHSGGGSRHGGSSHHSRYYGGHHSGYARGVAYDGGWRPHRGFVLAWGDGYRGPGYYYGPPGLEYYDYRPGVVYYRSRAVMPYEVRVRL